MSNITFENEAMVKGFTASPNHVMRDPLLSPMARLLYHTILSFAWGKEQAFPGQETLCGIMGCSDETIRKYLIELRTARLITWKQRGLGKTNLYTVLDLNPSQLGIRNPSQLGTNNTKYNNTQTLTTRGSKKSQNNVLVQPIDTMNQDSYMLATSKPVKRNREIPQPTDVEVKAKKFLEFFNKQFKTNFKSTRGWIRNFEYWLTDYDGEDIAKALSNTPKVSWLWSALKTRGPEVLFRRSNKLGDCNYLDTLLNAKTDLEISMELQHGSSQ